MRILVIGGTGKVGAHLVGGLVAAGAQVRVLTRSAERAAAISDRVETAIGSIMRDPDATAQAFDDIDAVFMLNQPTLEEVAEGLLAVELARAAGVGHFVYQSVHKAEAMAALPHVASKLAIERGIVASGMRWTFLRPNYFYQNDLTAKAGLERGLYVAPVGGIGVAAVDARDIAAAGVAALLDGGHDGRRYNLVGPDILTGETCAGIWSEAIGRTIRYAGDVAAWRAATRDLMPAWFNYDLGMMYAHLGTRGMLPDPGDLDQVTALLGRRPRSYRAFVHEQAALWSLAAVAA